MDCISPSRRTHELGFSDCLSAFGHQMRAMLPNSAEANAWVLSGSCLLVVYFIQFDNLKLEHRNS